MQGSFGEAQERFRGGKKRDTEQAKHHRHENKFRKARQNRHQEA